MSQSLEPRTIPQEVDEAIDLLHEKRGGEWWNEIELETFKINDMCRCIIGQLYGHYTCRDAIPLRVNPRGYGFETLGRPDKQIKELDEEWKRRLRGLQELSSSVNRGVALLDEKHPGWRDKIDLASLDMYNCVDCVLGQLFGEYVEGVRTELAGDFIASEKHGFILLPWDDNFLILDAVWRGRLSC